MVAFSGAFMYNMPCYPKEKRRKAREEREALRLIWIVMAAVAVCLYLLLLSPALSKRGKEALFGSRWYAHRGLHDGNLCENTLRAFEKAAKSGYGIELDVHLMIQNPEKQIESFAAAGAKYITVHAEAAGFALKEYIC